MSCGYFLLLFILSVAAAGTKQKGDCLYQGQLYTTGSVWRPEPCVVCSCHSKVVVCQPVICRDPRCNYPQEELLVIQSTSCCPECRSKMQPCRYNNELHQDMTVWHPLPCVTCNCDDGQVVCSNTSCPPLTCKYGQIKQHLNGQCCPQCIYSGRECSYGDATYSDGEEWQPMQCTLCVCRDGRHVCYTASCPVLDCQENETVDLTPGGCCPECIPASCVMGDNHYKEGEMWYSDSCTVCMCISGENVCTQQQCAAVSCGDNEQHLSRPGECCVTCIPAETPCTQGGRLHYHGDIWNVSSCEYCSCDKGRINCHTASCDHAQCNQGDVILHQEGKCCQECSSPKVCAFNSVVIQDGDSWQPDDCSICVCRKGIPSCYSRMCTVCRRGTVRRTIQGQCCGPCQPIKCGSHCLTCSPKSPDVCLICEDGHLLYNGLCVESCPLNYYSSFENACQACHSSCAICSDNSAVSCVSCKPPFVWNNGQCLHSCQQGYFNKSNSCEKCSADCLHCNEEGGCKSCRQAGKLLHFGSCLDSCPARYYVQSQQCQECEAGCRSCYIDNPKCTSCIEDTVMHNGFCVQKCPSGFFAAQNKVCRACHPSCSTCDGVATYCTSCQGRAQLHSGRCEHGCDLGKYLGRDGYCRDCDPTCSECYPSVRGTNVCTRCVKSSWMPHGDTCAASCGYGMFVLDGFCESCPTNCKTCSSLQDCTSCEESTFLLYGECVHNCGPARQRNSLHGTCSDCPEGCLLCDQSGCQSCKQGYYLKASICTDVCGKGFIENEEDKTCDDNSQKPSLRFPSTFTLSYGEVVTLNMSLFHVEQTSTKHIMFRLLDVPTKLGFFTLAGKPIKQDFPISFRHLDGNKVRFHAISPGRGVVKVVLDRGSHHSNIADLLIKVSSPDGPYLIRNEKIIVGQGKTVVISHHQHVDLGYNGDSSSLMIKVLQAPLVGLLRMAGEDTPVYSFTLSQLRKDEISYTHDGSMTNTDSILLQASDGQHTLNMMTDVLINIKEDNLTPVAINNKGAQLYAGGMVKLTSDMLEYKALSERSRKLMYVLTPPYNNPEHGELIMIVASPAGGPIKGWEDLGGSLMASRMYRFLQRDIDEGRIWYRQFKRSKGSLDLFNFEVSDTLNPPNILRGQTFKITVTEAQQDQASPTVAPGVRLGMTVYENQLIPITSQDLAYIDIDTEDNGIVYSITQPLEKDQGTVELVERPFHSTRRFTQQDINSNMVIYRPPIKELGSKEREFSFYFYVSDRASGKNLKEQKFTIKVKPVNNMAPTPFTSVAKVNVVQSGMVPIDSLLSVSDPDTRLDDLMYTMVVSPSAGQVMKSDAGIRAVLRSGDQFTHGEISDSVFFYQHDGSERLMDHIEFMVDDGAHNVPINVDVAITKVDRKTPVLVQGSTMTLEIKEGEVGHILRQHLAFYDADASDKGLTLAVTSQMLYGGLYRDAVEQIHPGNKFTQEDIDSQKISYVSSGEIGPRKVYDLLHFNVSDPTGNSLPNQTFSIVIHPMNNQAPMVKVGPGIQVEEGGQQTLSHHDISVIDIDTAINDLLVVIEALPKFGVIENVKAAHGSERPSQLRVTSFALQDLYDGHIIYSQTNHHSKEPVADGFLFHVSDGNNHSPTQRFNISILLQNDEGPLLVVKQISVEENRGITLTNASVYVMDFDTPPEDLEFIVINEPKHGSIRRKEFPQQMMINGHVLRTGASFTYKDVLKELVIYTHDGAEVISDDFSLRVSDGEFNDTKTILVKIGLVNDETPRMDVNHGIRVKAGSVTKITSSLLRATDVDSDDSVLIFIITQNPVFGEVRLYGGDGGGVKQTEGPISAIHQSDIKEGNVEYVHTAGHPSGVTFFKFNVADPDGNMLIDQLFMITVIDDHTPPTILSNKGLKVTEGTASKLTTRQLSASDIDSEPSALQYSLLTVPEKGHIELVTSPGVPITEFSQSDLAASLVQYVHTSEEEVYMDSFVFSVSDGSNDITQTFYITINPVDDSLPMVTSNTLRVQEGVRKTISEFDLKAEDLDTKEDHIIFQIIRPPLHGTVDMLDGDQYIAITYFKMSDIYENRVSYKHDGTESKADSFDLLVTDGINSQYTFQSNGSMIVSADPMVFNVDVQPVDDGAPILEVNLGLHYLEYVDNKPMNVITKRELKAKDSDTPDDLLFFRISKSPEHGYLEKADRQGEPITSFSQADLNDASIRYVLTENSGNTTSDAFVFSLADSKPNLVEGFSFYIIWSVISFEKPSFNVTEQSGLIKIPVRRYGNLKQYAVIQCGSVPGQATSSTDGTRPGQHDFVEHSGQVQFDEWQAMKMCTIIINDDSIYEGAESFTLQLSQPAYALVGEVQTAQVTIYDVEDEPVIQFEEGMYFVNESDGSVHATMLRSGDISTSVSAVCSTKSLTAKGSGATTLESGSDYKSSVSRVVFTPGITQSSCTLQIIDDSIFEPPEQFEIMLSEPSMNARIGPLNKAVVIIDGPNDESMLFFPEDTFYFNEDANKIQLPVIRQGTDLSHTSMVWCATRMTESLTATPGQDYIPTSNQITFEPGQVIQHCLLTILDDESDPRMEGNETFAVFLSSPMGSMLADPHSAIVTINDSLLDTPTMQFELLNYVVDEDEQYINVPIVRSGDLSYQSSVICYTRQNSAHVMMDYDERPLTEQSRVVFQPGDKVKMCKVAIVNDADQEDDEMFFLKLANAEGSQECGAQMGPSNTASIKITNPSDTPTISLSNSVYSVSEPGAAEESSFVVVKVIRTGDVNQTSNVRCSTRDGSALSGIDYNPRSKMLKFKPGIQEIDFKVEVLYNDEIEWHETFNVQLGPREPVNAVLGDISIATVTILDHEVSGSVVLPAPPVVVSLLDYDNVEVGMTRSPSPGYPIVCVTPCDIHYPTYTTTNFLCDELGINRTAMQYAWEISSPPDKDGARPPFETVTDNTLFTNTNHMILESFYFRPGFNVRCVSQPVHNSGNLGVPLRSSIVDIGYNNGICRAPISAGNPHGLQAQSFVASLHYVEPTDSDHPNRVHISVQIPHQDGMLPLISTLPLHNLRFLLSEPIYRQQHVCSNIITPAERLHVVDFGFLDAPVSSNLLIGPGFDKPYQFDINVRETKAINLYKHLNLKSCIWTFEAWYHMTELIDICGGSVLSNFKVRDAGQTYLSVYVPLYVSYIYAMAPTGWASMEQHTEMEFSFFYDTILWKSGLETEGKLSGRLQVLKIAIRDSGKLQIDFKTKTKFRGQYVKMHHTTPKFKSRVVPPDGISVDFELTLLWSEMSFDGPNQLWRAISNYNLKDYSGDYVIELIPCTVSSTKTFSSTKTKELQCTAHSPEKFFVPIAFQQTNRPVALEYSLNTDFQIHNHKKMFLLNPSQINGQIDVRAMNYQGAFSEGQTIFGRVLWSPAQDLDTAFKLRIEKLYICTGKDGHVPTFDPTGELFKEGPQFGCIQPSGNIKHRFLILDRGNPSAVTKSFHDVDFNAQLASDNEEYSTLEDLPGVDGFTFQVDPLFKVESGHQWYLQVLYIIGPADRLQSYRLFNSRRKRDGNQDDSIITGDWISNKKTHNGTNIKFVKLDINEISAQVKNSDQNQESSSIAVIVGPSVVGFVLIALIIVGVVVFVKWQQLKTKKGDVSNVRVSEKNLAVHYFKELKKDSSVDRKNINICKDDLATDSASKYATVSTVQNKNLQIVNNKLNGNGTEV